MSVKVRVVDNIKETIFQTLRDSCIKELTVIVTACTRNAQSQTNSQTRGKESEREISLMT